MNWEKRVTGPIIFGAGDHQLFGWYHAPARPARRAGVVLCNPFGYEAMCLHRVYRTLAERLAASGIPALRFDYHGTGDSAGGDDDPARVAAWRRSVGAAIDELRRRAGVDDISLFGIRFGATMAMLAALERHDVSSLVLWSPYLTGRAFLREMRMMQTAGAEQAFASAQDRGVSPEVRKSSPELPEAATPADEEAIGYVLTQETVKELGRIDLREKKESPAPRVLLLGRDDLPDDGRLTKHLSAVGTDVTDLTGLPGYSAMMQDAYLSKVPREAFDQVIVWLGRVVHAEYEEEEEQRTPTLLDLSREGPHLIARRADEERAAREEALMFGPRSRLLGILCEPAVRGPAQTRDAVVFLNVGSNHRVGSNRMYVKMARTLAARGMTSLRFDVSGIGDSVANADFENRLYAPEAVIDAQAAMTELTELRAVERFYLVGLCSGAYLAFKTAVADPRVAGQVLINTQTFSWREGDTLDVSLRQNYRSTRFYTQEMWNPQTWKRVIKGEVNARGIASTLAERAVARAVRGAQGTLARVRHGRLEIDDVAADFKDIAKRGAETLLVFGANDGGLDLMEAHLGPRAKKLEKFPNFDLEIVDGTDHTFTPVWSQTWLETLIVKTVERWRASSP